MHAYIRVRYAPLRTDPEYDFNGYAGLQRGNGCVKTVRLHGCNGPGRKFFIQSIHERKSPGQTNLPTGKFYFLDYRNVYSLRLHINTWRNGGELRSRKPGIQYVRAYKPGTIKPAYIRIGDRPCRNDSSLRVTSRERRW